MNQTKYRLRFAAFQPAQKRFSRLSPGAALPKLSQALASFPAMPSTLPLRCFSAQIQKKILTKITTEISTRCKLGPEVVERNLVIIRRPFPEKELDSCILIQDQTVFHHHPPLQMLLQGRSSRSVYKTLRARSFLQQHQGVRTANKSHFANLGSLLLVGGEACKEHLLQINETGPQKLKQGEAIEQS